MVLRQHLTLYGGGFLLLDYCIGFEPRLAQPQTKSAGLCLKGLGSAGRTLSVYYTLTFALQLRNNQGKTSGTLSERYVAEWCWV